MVDLYLHNNSTDTLDLEIAYLDKEIIHLEIEYELCDNSKQLIVLLSKIIKLKLDRENLRDNLLLQTSSLSTPYD